MPTTASSTASPIAGNKRIRATASAPDLNELLKKQMDLMLERQRERDKEEEKRKEKDER